MKALLIFVATWVILTTLSSGMYQNYNQNDDVNYESSGNRLDQRNLKKKGGKQGSSKSSQNQNANWMNSKNQKNSKNENKNKNMNNNNNKTSQQTTNANKNPQNNQKSNNNNKQNTSSNNKQNNFWNQSNTQKVSQAKTHNSMSSQSNHKNSNKDHNQYNRFNFLDHFNLNHNYNNRNHNYRSRQKQKKIYELFKTRIETWTKRLKMTQIFKDQEDQELFRMKNLEVNWKNRDNLVQSVLNMERSIYSEQDKLANLYKNQHKNKTNRLLKTDAKFFKKNQGKLVRNLNWKYDIFQ